MICISYRIVHVSRVEKCLITKTFHFFCFLFFRQCQGSATESVSLNVVSVFKAYSAKILGQ